MRILFMGSAPLACPSMDAVLADPDLRLVGVVTQPDRPKGRRLQTSPCAARAHAEAAGAEVLTPANVNTPESLAGIRALQPDAIVVVAYGQLLKPALLAVPPLGCLNVHASLLPAYRGAAPIQWAIANGERVSGVTTMLLNARMDAGDMLMQRAVPIDRDDTAGTLHDKLAAAGAELLAETLRAVRDGSAQRTPQDESRATYAPKLTKGDGRIDWTQPAGTVYNRVRAFNPYPCCFCRLPDGETLRVLRVAVERGAAPPPGTILEADARGPLLQCGEGAVRLLEVQPAGRRPMSGEAFLNGHPLRAGDRLE